MATKTKRPNLLKQTKDEFCTCGGNTFNTIASLSTTDYAGVLADGSRYTSIARNRLQCTSCGQFTIQKLYQYDASKWQE